MRTILFIAFMVAGRLLAQESGADSVVPDMSRTDTSTKREANLEGREVVASIRGEAGSVRRIGRQELDEAGTLGDALSRIPGVEIRRTGGLGGYTEISLRQCPAEQVRVVLDGSDISDMGNSTIDLGLFLPSGLERAEVVQGAGIDAEGRPLLILTSRRAWGMSGGSATAGSFGERRLSAWWGGDSGTTSISAWWAQSQNNWPILWDRATPRDPNDDTTIRLTNNDFTGWGAAGAWKPSQRLQLSVRADGEDQGVSGLYTPHPHARWKKASAQAGLVSRGEGRWDWPVEANFRWNGSRWQDSGSSIDYRSNTEAGQQGWNAGVFGGLSRNAGDWTDGWFRAGFSGETDEWTTTTPKLVHLTPDATRRIWSLSGGWKGRDLGNTIGASAIVRMDMIDDSRDFQPGELDVVRASPDSSWNSRAYSSNLRIWARTGDGIWQTWMGAGMDQKPPDFFELYGDNGRTFQNLSLRPERSWTSEVGGSWTYGIVKVQIVPWAGLYKDPIRRQFLGASQASRFENDSGYTAAGIESDATVCTRWGSLRGSAAWNRTFIRSEYSAYEGNELDHSPRARWNAVATSPVWRGGTLEGTLDGVGSSWATPLNASDDRQPGHVVYGLRTSWRVGRFRAAFQADNLTDVRFQEIENAPLSGRSWHLTLQADLNNIQVSEKP